MTNVEATPAMAPAPAVVLHDEDDVLLSFGNTATPAVNSRCTCSNVVNKMIAERLVWVMVWTIDAGIRTLVDWSTCNGWAVRCGVSGCHIPAMTPWMPPTRAPATPEESMVEMIMLLLEGDSFMLLLTSFHCDWKNVWDPNNTEVDATLMRNNGRVAAIAAVDRLGRVDLELLLHNKDTDPSVVACRVTFG